MRPQLTIPRSPFRAPNGMSDQFAVLGDVHGEGVRLSRALADLRDLELKIVLVGDYVNRGPDSRGVVQQLLKAKRELGDSLILLRGNHDQALIDYLEGGILSDFVAHGGFETMRSYLFNEITDGAVRTFRARFPRSHLELLRSTIDFYEDNDIFVSHSGFNPSRPRSRLPEDLRGGYHTGLFDHTGPWPRPTVVCGHFVQHSGKPFMSESLVCVDTGCGTLADHPLTAVLLPSRQIKTY